MPGPKVITLTSLVCSCKQTFELDVRFERSFAFCKISFIDERSESSLSLPPSLCLSHPPFLSLSHKLQSKFIEMQTNINSSSGTIKSKIPEAYPIKVILS